MKTVILVLSLLFSYPAFSQVKEDISIFHRLLIVNSENEVMVAKIENTDIWVTPGFYHNTKQAIKTSLDSIAATYSEEANSPQLKGVFTLKRDLDDKVSTSLRNVYLIRVNTLKKTLPSGIGEVKWLPLEEALQLITFPHISAMIEQIMNNPKQIWGGTLLQFKEDDNWSMKLIEEFYPL